MKYGFVVLLTVAFLGGCDGSAPKPASPDLQKAPAAAAPVPGANAKAGDDAARKAADPNAVRNRELAAKVHAALAAAPGLNAPAIDVVAKDGQVSLFGTVATEKQRRDSEKVAGGVAGVSAVRNELKIVQGS